MEENKETMYEDADVIIKRAIRLTGNNKDYIIQDEEPMEAAVFKLLTIIQDLCDRIENPKIIKLS